MIKHWNTGITPLFDKITQETSKLKIQDLNFQEKQPTYILINVTVMYRDTEFIVLNCCPFNIFGNPDKGTKNLQR